MIHSIKCGTDAFAALWAGTKKFEFRRNDRGYQVNDVLDIREYGGGEGRYILATISYMLEAPLYGVPDGFAVLSIDEIDRGIQLPVPIALACPRCHQQHVDEGEWATRPHRTHLCVAGPCGPGCGAAWRPADVATVGVRRPWNLTPEQMGDTAREVAEQSEVHRDDHPNPKPEGAR